jgi:hypothetical protein
LDRIAKSGSQIPSGNESPETAVKKAEMSLQQINAALEKVRSRLLSKKCTLAQTAAPSAAQAATSTMVDEQSCMQNLLDLSFGEEECLDDPGPASVSNSVLQLEGLNFEPATLDCSHPPALPTLSGGKGETTEDNPVESGLTALQTGPGEDSLLRCSPQSSSFSFHSAVDVPALVNDTSGEVSTERNSPVTPKLQSQ